MSTSKLDRAPRGLIATSPTTGSAKALVKGVALVKAVAAAPAPVRAGRLAEIVGIPRPTVQRLLDVLIDEGVFQGNVDAGFSLGPRLAVWGQGYLDSLDVRQQAVELMRQLSEGTRETCFLGVREHSQIVYVAKVDGPQAVRPAAWVGASNPLHSTAIGKALLCWAPDETVCEYSAAHLERRTENTIVESRLLAKELEATRQRGYAIDNVENEEGVRCVAAPIRDHRGEVVAALSVSAPAYRFSLHDLRQLAPRVLVAAEELSKRCGYSPATKVSRTEGGRRRSR